MLGISNKTIQYWETGVTHPNAENFNKLVEIFLRRSVFSRERELEEAEELWEKVREKAPRLKSIFDRHWFNGVLQDTAPLRTGNPPAPILLHPTLLLPQPAVPNNIPLRLTSFVGREQELAWLSANLNQTVATRMGLGRNA